MITMGIDRCMDSPKNLNRRDFLKLGLAGVGSAVIGMPLAWANDEPLLYSASDRLQALQEKTHHITSLNIRSGELEQWTIPFRAHDILPLPAQQQVVAFGRRPDRFCAMASRGQPDVQLIEASQGRHFYGHGCLNKQADTLFTTENDYDAARGVVGIRDLTTHRPLGEYETYGVGPHDIHLMPDGKTLVIANGGIKTHPDFGRRKLNIKTMQPSLVYIDVENGKKIDEYRLDDHQLSIRHLTVTKAGDVGVATQYQGKLYQRQPKSLVAWQKQGAELQTLGIEEKALKPLKGYMADLAVDTEQQLLAVTSPRGNQVAFWDIRAQAFMHALNVPQPSGIVFQAETGKFLVSSATGSVYEVTATQEKSVASAIKQFANLMWDNHMMLV